MNEIILIIENNTVKLQINLQEAGYNSDSILIGSIEENKPLSKHGIIIKLLKDNDKSILTLKRDMEFSEFNTIPINIDFKSEELLKETDRLKKSTSSIENMIKDKKIVKTFKKPEYKQVFDKPEFINIFCKENIFHEVEYSNGSIKNNIILNTSFLEQYPIEKGTLVLLQYKKEEKIIRKIRSIVSQHGSLAITLTGNIFNEIRQANKLKVYFSSYKKKSGVFKPTTKGTLVLNSSIVKSDPDNLVANRHFKETTKNILKNERNTQLENYRSQ